MSRALRLGSLVVGVLLGAARAGADAPAPPGRSIQPTGGFVAVVRAGEVVSLTGTGVVLVVRAVTLPRRGRPGTLRVLAAVDGRTAPRTIAIVSNGANPRWLRLGPARVGAMVSEDGRGARIGATLGRGFPTQDACDVDADCVLTDEADCERLCVPRPLHRDQVDTMHHRQRLITCPSPPPLACPPGAVVPTRVVCETGRCRAH